MQEMNVFDLIGFYAKNHPRANFPALDSSIQIKNEEDNILKANLWYNLGIIYEQMCEYDDSEESFDQAFFLNGEDHEACLGMARAYEGQGNRYYAGGKDSCGNEVDKDLYDTLNILINLE